MRIGVVSDTHAHLEYTRQAIRVLESMEVELVIHCGDIGSPEIVSLFQQWPTHFVFGNVDYDHATLAQAISAAGLTCHHRFGQLTLAGRKIAFLHSDDQQTFQQAIDSGDWDLICYGHTHVADKRTAGDTILLNPGALYRATPHSLAIVDLPELEIQAISL